MARLILPYQSVYDLNGHPLPGAQMYFYESGTVTPKDTYSDEALTTPNANPVIADSQGQFGDIFLSGAYSVKLDDANDVTQPDYPAEIEAAADSSSTVLLTGNQTIAGVKTFTDRLAVKADTPTYELEENDAPSDNRLWQLVAIAEQFIFRVANDVRDTFGSIFTVDRTGTTVDTIDFLATNIKHNGVDMYAAIDEDSMASDSAVLVPTQQSTKAYVDAKAGPFIFNIGAWDMNASAQATIATGFSAAQLAKVRGMSGVVRSDTATTAFYNITAGYYGTETIDLMMRQIGSDGSLNIDRKTSSIFDGTSFDLVEFNLDNDDAVDKGAGLVGIPITAHSFKAGDVTTIAGTTNYDATYTIISFTTDEIVITATYAAETFAGTETASFSRGWVMITLEP
jgi:hypothetical protein